MTRYELSIFVEVVFVEKNNSGYILICSFFNVLFKTIKNYSIGHIDYVIVVEISHRVFIKPDPISFER